MFLIWPVSRSRQLLPPHRSTTQMVLPSRSISTALVEPIFRPSGNFTKCSMVLYEFGASLVGVVASGGVPEVAASSTPPAIPLTAITLSAKLVIRRPRGINEPPWSYKYRDSRIAGALSTYPSGVEGGPDDFEGVVVRQCVGLLPPVRRFRQCDRDQGRVAIGVQTL